MWSEGVTLNVGLAIVIVALALIGAIALLGLLVLAFAVFLWMRASQGAPPVPLPVPEPVSEDPATEVFDRGRLFEVFDSDDMDQTELVRLDGGILLDGRTDPAVLDRAVGPGKRKP